MRTGILLQGIHTNNLKNINITIPYEKLTVIAGISGSGKSSLAIHTAYELCKQEFNALESGYSGMPRYALSSYSGIIPAISIRQKNININPRSSLYTYLNIPSILANAFIYGDSDIPPQNLSINSVYNYCKTCNGLGYINNVDMNKVINESKSINELPFLSWKSYSSNHYLPLLIAFCEDNDIPTNIPFKNLTDVQKENILYANTEKKYQVRYKNNNKYRVKSRSYVGPLAELTSFLHSGYKSDMAKLANYTGQVVCHSCRGAKFAPSLFVHDVFGLSLDNFMTLEFQEILETISSYLETRKKYPSADLLLQLLKSLTNCGLGYLHLSRSIPSLSGGEVQKLNLARMLSSSMSGVLFVLDEISAQLHVSEYEKIYTLLMDSIERKNTILLVEHSDFFIKRAEHLIVIGPGSGKAGGNIISPQSIERVSSNRTNTHKKKSSFINLPPISKNNVNNVSLKIPQNALTGLCGVSGSGKSSYVTALSELLPNIELASQRQLRGNIRSTVATYLDYQKKIATLYAKENNISEDIFSFAAGKPGACPVCEGRGKIKYERSFDEPILIECDTCNGLRFSPEVHNFTLNGISIDALFQLDIDSIIEDKIIHEKGLVEQFLMLQRLALGHLSLNREISSLSGGEAQRIKIAKIFQKRSTNKILVLDEPGAGLDSQTIQNFLDELATRVLDYQAIIVVEHKTQILLAMDYLIEFGPGGGKNGGEIIAFGPTLNSKNSIIGSFLT